MLVPFLTCSFETCVCLRRKSLERNLLRLLLTAAGIPRRHFIPILNRIANRTVIPHFLLNMLQIGFHALDFFAYILLMFLENGNHLVNISRDIILKPEKLLNPRNRKTGALEAENCGHAVNVLLGVNSFLTFGMNDIRQKPDLLIITKRRGRKSKTLGHFTNSVGLLFHGKTSLK